MSNPDDLSSFDPEDPTTDPGFGGDSQGRRNRFVRFARRMLEPGALGEDARDAIVSLLETSDRAKSEMVRMVAREVRNYLDELKLKEGVRDLLTGHSLEVQMSLSLKPLASALEDDAPATAEAEPEDHTAESATEDEPSE